MQTYDVHHLELFDIKSGNGYVYHLGLLPGESVAGLGGVQVIHVGHRVTIDLYYPWETTVRIDYDQDGNVIWPLYLRDIHDLIKKLTESECTEYTPDLLRAIQQRKTELKPWEVDHRLRL